MSDNLELLFERDAERTQNGAVIQSKLQRNCAHLHVELSELK